MTHAAWQCRPLSIGLSHRPPPRCTAFRNSDYDLRAFLFTVFNTFLALKTVFDLPNFTVTLSSYVTVGDCNGLSLWHTAEGLVPVPAQ